MFPWAVLLPGRHYEKLKSSGAVICSMGMSSDFELAIECGSNMVRLGSILFKED